MSAVEQRLPQLNVLPAASNSQANYTSCVEAAGLLFVAGEGPLAIAGKAPKGKLDREFTTREGYEFACMPVRCWAPPPCAPGCLS